MITAMRSEQITTANTATLAIRVTNATTGMMIRILARVMERVERQVKAMNEEWNLGGGLANVCNSAMRKLHYAGHQLEERNRTIVNLESYEVTAMIWALTEYMKRRGMN